jgi:hypothetical protein
MESAAESIAGVRESDQAAPDIGTRAEMSQSHA